MMAMAPMLRVDGKKRAQRRESAPAETPSAESLSIDGGPSSPPPSSGPAIQQSTGRLELWFGGIVYLYAWILTVMSAISKAWVVEVSTITNGSCKSCSTWEPVHDKDDSQVKLLGVSAGLGALGYLCLALRWFRPMAPYPILQWISIALLLVVISCNFTAYTTYHSTYGASTVYPNPSLYFGTGYDFAQIAAVYGCIALILLLIHEARELHHRWRIRRMRREQGFEVPQRAGFPSLSPLRLSPLPPIRYSGIPTSAHSGDGPSLGAVDGRGGDWGALALLVDEWGIWMLSHPTATTDVIRLNFLLKDHLSPTQKLLILGANAFLLLLYFGGLLVSELEGWALQDGVNYILAAWCTLGYGEYIPVTTGARLMMYIYWPIGFFTISSTSAVLWRVFLYKMDSTVKEKGAPLKRRISRLKIPSTLTDGRHRFNTPRTSEKDQRMLEMQQKRSDKTQTSPSVPLNSIDPSSLTPVEPPISPSRYASGGERESNAHSPPTLRLILSPPSNSHFNVEPTPTPPGVSVDTAGTSSASSPSVPSVSLLIDGSSPSLSFSLPADDSDISATPHRFPEQPVHGPPPPLVLPPSPPSPPPSPPSPSSHSQSDVDHPLSNPSTVPMTQPPTSTEPHPPDDAPLPTTWSLISSLFLRLVIAVLSVFAWVCVAGGFYFWSEDYAYSYFDCQWSAFNLLTTISVGTFSTPFTTATSAYFVWYQLFGVGTLAYCFAVMAEMARTVMDNEQKKKQQHQQRRRKDSTASSTGPGSSHSDPVSVVLEQSTERGPPTAMISLSGFSGGAEADSVKVTADYRGDARALFLAHAKALDRLVLDLLLAHKRPLSVENGEKEDTKEEPDRGAATRSEKGFSAQTPAVVVQGDNDSDKEGGVRLEGLTILVRSHLQLQALREGEEAGEGTEVGLGRLLVPLHSHQLPPVTISSQQADNGFPVAEVDHDRPLR